MKIRKGFVSNSSTSSFVLLGVKIDVEKIRKKFKKEDDPEDIEIYELLEETAYEILSDDDIDLNENEHVIGHTIASGDDSDFNGPNISLSDLNKIADNISEEFDVNKSELKIYSGWKQC